MTDNVSDLGVEKLEELALAREADGDGSVKERPSDAVPLVASKALLAARSTESLAIAFCPLLTG